MSHGFIQQISMHRAAPSRDPCRQGLSVHTSAYAYVLLSAAVGVVSEEFSVRDEQRDTNKLAKYENWMTTNG